jgi:hypothetical protein
MMLISFVSGWHVALSKKIIIIIIILRFKLFIAKPEMPIREKQIVFTYCSVRYLSAFIHGDFRKREVATC